MLESAGYTDKARRQHNEDAYLLNDELNLYVVADGVGGLQAGEVASQLVCEVVAQQVQQGASLETAILTAHTEVSAAAERGEGRSGMASTVVVVRFDGSDYELAWVGDSRIYLWDGELKLLTKDHSYVQSLYDAGQITLAETDTHPKKNVITQAVGSGAAEIKVASNRGTLAQGQSLLLCSDGVSGELTGKQLVEKMSSKAAAAQISKELVQCAVQAGGKDNATCVYVRASETDVAATDEQTARSFSPQVFRTYDAANDSYIGEQKSQAAQNDADENIANTPVEQTTIVRVAPKAEPLESQLRVKDNKSWWPINLIIVGLGLIAVALFQWISRG